MVSNQQHIRAVVCLAACITALCGVVWADTPLPSKTRSKGIQPFVVNRDNAPIYVSDKGPSKKPRAAAMGELYCATQESAGRFKIGEWEPTAEKFTEVGWMESSHLLQNTTPQTVGQAVEAKAIDPSIAGKNASSFTRANALDLRVVSKPEAKMTPSKTPGVKGTPGPVDFTWYYVYATETIGETVYFLISPNAALYDTETIFNTASETAQARLQGWVAKDTVKEWCSNLVLEYNCDREAVNERYVAGPDRLPDERKSKPAEVYDNPGLTGRAVAREPLLDFWGHEYGVEQDAATRLAHSGDRGLMPSVPRLHIVEKGDGATGGDVYRVASLGSLTGNISPSRVAELLQATEQVTAALGKVDIVFVVDCTGSMKDEIETVGIWMKDLTRGFEERSKRGSGNIPVVIQGVPQVISGRLDIRVSILGYQDIGGRKGKGAVAQGSQGFGTWTFLEGVALEGKTVEIDSAIDAMVGSLGGGNEALHDGLHSALDNREMWRSDCALRLIIVVADEKGETGGKTQDDVLSVMKLPDSGGPLDGDPRVRPINTRRRFTLIHGVYTGEDFNAFEANLGKLMIDADDNNERKKQLFHLPRFKDDAAQRQNMIDVFYEPIKEVQNDLGLRILNLTDQIAGKTNRSPDAATVVRSPTALLLDEIAIKMALKSAGVKDINELRALTEVAFIEGWVQIRQKGHSYDTFRMCVTMPKVEVDTLGIAMGSLAEAIDDTFRPGIQLFKDDPKKLVATALVRGIAIASGKQAEITDRDDLASKVSEFLAEVDNKPGINMQSFLNLKASLPVSSEGLFGLEIKQILEMKDTVLLDQARDLRRKQKCLRNINNGQTAPAKFQDIEGHESSSKQWIYKHPMSGDEFIYVPLEYIP